MKKWLKSPIKVGLLQAVGVYAYVLLVSTVMMNGEKIFGKAENILAPLMVLTLFVTSALICGLLVFGYAIVNYSKNQKIDIAVKTVLYTGGWMVTGLLLLMLVLALV